MKVRANLVYGVTLDADVGETSPLRMLNVAAILDQATRHLSPRLDEALRTAAKMLTVVGVKVAFSGAKLEIKPIEE